VAGDALKKVQSGERLRIPAGAYNTFVDVAQAHRAAAHRIGARAGAPPPESGIVLAKNTTEADLGRFDVLGIDGVLITPADNEAEFIGQTALAGVIPTADHAGRFVILLEPLAAGAIGRAMLQGVTRARLYVQEDRTVAFADVATDKTAYLVPAAGGVQVLWRVGGASENEADLKWALVRLPHAASPAGEAEVTSVTSNGTWITSVEAHPLAPDGSPDTSITLTLKATDIGSEPSSGIPVGFADGDIAVGHKVGYLTSPGRSEACDGWLLPHAGADGPRLSLVEAPSPTILAGPGIIVEYVGEAQVPKVSFDPVLPGGGLAWEPVGPGDASQPYVLVDTARGMGLDVDGIFVDLLAKGGLQYSGDPADPDRDLMAKVDGDKAMYIDQSVDDKGIQCLLASDTYDHGPDWLTGSGLQYCTSAIGGVLGISLHVAQFGGLKMSPLEVYADGNFGVTKDGETGELEVQTGTGLELNGGPGDVEHVTASSVKKIRFSFAGCPEGYRPAYAYTDQSDVFHGWYDDIEVTFDADAMGHALSVEAIG